MWYNVLPACIECDNEDLKVIIDNFEEMRSKLHEGKKTQSFVLSFMYRTCALAIITRGLYIFHPIF